eukprot:c16121_g1_i1.p1 GENE.c16121_g1_i1~~c16121_g1_i1.p1  ORF type:complete len:214 (+),score=30.25 c16121_g1_i1:23-643(+)
MSNCSICADCVGNEVESSKKHEKEHKNYQTYLKSVQLLQYSETEEKKKIVTLIRANFKKQLKSFANRNFSSNSIKLNYSIEIQMSIEHFLAVFGHLPFLLQKNNKLTIEIVGAKGKEIMDNMLGLDWDVYEEPSDQQRPEGFVVALHLFGSEYPMTISFCTEKIECFEIQNGEKIKCVYEINKLNILFHIFSSVIQRQIKDQTTHI